MGCWYEPDGLRFSCREGCSACCRGEPGVVAVDKRERRLIAAWLGLEEKVFLLRYCRSRGLATQFLKERPNGDCVFVTAEDRCSIYAVRPRQCRSYPFWKNILVSRAAWEREGRLCPGIDRGRLYGPGEITER